MPEENEDEETSSEDEEETQLENEEVTVDSTDIDDECTEESFTKTQDTFNSIVSVDKPEFQNMRCPRCNEMTFSVVKVKDGKSKFVQCLSCGYFEGMSDTQKKIMEKNENGK